MNLHQLALKRFVLTWPHANRDHRHILAVTRRWDMPRRHQHTRATRSLEIKRKNLVLLYNNALPNARCRQLAFGNIAVDAARSNAQNSCSLLDREVVLIDQCHFSPSTLFKRDEAMFKIAPSRKTKRLHAPANTGQSAPLVDHGEKCSCAKQRRSAPTAAGRALILPHPSMAKTPMQKSQHSQAH